MLSTIVDFSKIPEKTTVVVMPLLEPSSSRIKAIHGRNLTSVCVAQDMQGSKHRIAIWARSIA